MPAETKSTIGGKTVASASPFIVYSPSHGIVSEHKSEVGAMTALARRMSQHPDGCVYMAHGGEWVPCYNHGAE